MQRYSKVLKDAKDLLSKPHSFDQKAEIKTTASNGTAYTGTVSISDKDGSASAAVKAEAKSSTFSVDKVEVTSGKTLAGEFSLKEAAPNTKFSFKFTDGSRASDADITASVGVEYTVPDAGVVTVDANVVGGPTFDFSGLFDYEGVLAGASASVAASSGDGDEKKGPAVTDANVLLGYRTGDYTLAASTTKWLSVVNVSLVHKASKDLKAGFVASFPRSGDKGTFDIAVGGEYKLDNDTTVSSAANSKGTVSLTYKQRLNGFATVSASGQVDAMQLGSDNHKFGLTLQLGN
uniref:Porin domain-containing protein n=1 Tax=Pseudictyota dubia TaxID=2749911 RepID=A0A7R9VX27_9STRA|mmetsp:Transcript_24495/g.45283  ORF Transcript_24495/g.45283 Transcript_24495/m.45283 type:complete len:291 (+) Transcript_24495:86-958(+)|eukprot:TRINITY_DN81454_c0_g1_i1.p2 TRINITY_DN81454_c0_g1~~TRINITY_DN81454_c0_g1_i1.p2  ORF type:complete len:291 (-),score=101.78 TRINITY_DN81454_c0_g1_i1:226-1098(-)